MKISVIIATYNAGAFLPRCLRSIQEQNYREVEVLVQDGGSTDATLTVLQQFVDQGLPLRWRSEPDRGIYDALNKAIPQAQGDLLVILGSDDALAPGALATVSETARCKPADIYPGQALCMYPDGRRALFTVDPCDKRAFLLSNPFCHNAMYASKAAYQAVGLYGTKYTLASDTQWVHQAIKKGLTFEPVDAVLVHFYIGGASSDPQMVMDETYSLLQDNFPGLSLDDAKYLLYVSKGWATPDRLEEVLAGYPDNHALHDAAHLAADYAPFSSQRGIDAAVVQAVTTVRNPLKILKRLYNKLLPC